MLNSQDFQYHKPVTPYICSTPLDFLNEKKHLSECIYPELSKACKARGSYFKPTNLLWEPGAQNLVKGLYLKTQLDAINRCSPFFIGLLGETYGPFRDESRELLTEFETSSININHLHWLDKNIMLAAAGGHPWVLDKETKQHKEWLAQECFSNCHVENFVASEELEHVFQQLTDFVLNSGEHKTDLNKNIVLHSSLVSSNENKRFSQTESNTNVILLVGERGIGKSTLVAQWLKLLKDEGSNTFVVSHFVSASCHSSSIKNFIRQSIRKLRSHFMESDNKSKFCQEIESDHTNQNFIYLCESFSAALALGPSVIVLDGIDELGSDADKSIPMVKSCCWLPVNIPSTCKFVLTTTPSDISYYNLSQRTDVRIIKCPNTLKDSQIISKMLKRHLNQIPHLLQGEKTLNNLINLKIMQTALNFQLVASEVKNYRCYSSLSFLIDSCAEMSSLSTFWNACLKNWIEDISWTLAKPSPQALVLEKQFESQGWVVDALCLLAASRNGLFEHQIVSLLEMIGYRNDSEITSYDWLQFRLSTDGTLLESLDGRLIFSHQSIREIVECSLFNVIPPMASGSDSIHHEEVVGKSRPYHCFLADYFLQQPLDIQVMEELPWQHMKLRKCSELSKILTNFSLLDKFMKCETPLWEEDLHLYWSVCHKAGIIAGSEYMQTFKAVCKKKLTTKSLTEAADEIVDFQDEMFLPSIHPKISMSCLNIVSIGWYIANYLHNSGSKDHCLELLELIIMLIKECPCLTSELQLYLCHCYYTFGTFYQISRDFDLAETNYKLFQLALIEADNMDKESRHQSDISYLKTLLLCCLSNIHIVHYKLLAAEELLLEARESLKKEPYSYLLKSTILFNLALIRGTDKDYNQAESLLRQSAKLRIQWFGDGHNLVANVQTALAMVLACPGNVKGFDIQQAEVLLRRALLVFERSFSSTHYLVSGVLHYLGLVLSENKNPQCQMEAQKYLQKSLDISLIEIGDKDLDVTFKKPKERFLNVASGEYDLGYSLFHHNRPPHWKLPSVDIFQLIAGSHIQGALKWNIPSHAWIPGRHKLQSGNRQALLSSKQKHATGKSSSKKTLLAASFRPSPVALSSYIKRADRLNETSNCLLPERASSVKMDFLEDDLATSSRKRQLITVNLLQDTETDDEMVAKDITTAETYRIKNDKKSVRIRSADAPRKLFQRYGGSQMAGSKTITTRNLWSGQSSRTCSSSGSHYFHCSLQGCHDITLSNTNSIAGPHSDLSSLLGQPPCPRPVTKNIYHHSAWYHVPGRYLTPPESFVKKRMQKTDNAKDIEAFIHVKSQWLNKSKVN
ncbi:putative tetratricopeptide repeat protein 41 isoform X2 [Biomphalaria glabrata]|uniref:Tetratricopeptide repeat protein 41 isoform X2 n=1 Tax=Biomphalaria glabrata TaxID=6526 RepID=A0A9W3A361_BIOGL|nr:putative tetratricopeptide repeat protein 41 isoform X2 [Biomphalaria glabrata]